MGENPSDLTLAARRIYHALLGPDWQGWKPATVGQVEARIREGLDDVTIYGHASSSCGGVGVRRDDGGVLIYFAAARMSREEAARAR